jgi:hypothetical protein
VDYYLGYINIAAGPLRRIRLRDLDQMFSKLSSYRDKYFVVKVTLRPLCYAIDDPQEPLIWIPP